MTLHQSLSLSILFFSFLLSLTLTITGLGLAAACFTHTSIYYPALSSAPHLTRVVAWYQALTAKNTWCCRLILRYSTGSLTICYRHGILIWRFVVGGGCILCDGQVYPKMERLFRLLLRVWCKREVMQMRTAVYNDWRNVWLLPSFTK